MDFKIHLSYKLVWYAAIIWLATFVISSTMVLPWSYLASAFLVFAASVFYVRGEAGKYNKRNTGRDVIFEIGLFASIVWFGAITIISILEIAGFYYFDVGLFFSDIRNWILFPLILVMPVVYSLVLDGKKNKKRKRARNHLPFYINNFFLKPL